MTLNVYAVPFVNPVTVVEVAGGAPVIVVGACATAPMNGVTVYDVIALPLFAGRRPRLTVADAFPAVADTPDGAAGAVGPLGVTAFDAADAGPVPTPFVAVTLNVYAVPFVNPVTVVEVAGGAPVIVVGACATAPMNGVTVYDVIALPLLAGAVHVTVADASPAVADTPVGAAGAVADTELVNVRSTE